MSRRRSAPPSSSVSPAIWLATGAAAGLVVGIAIADRAPTARRLLRGAATLLPALSGLLRAAGPTHPAVAVMPAIADLAASAVGWADEDDDVWEAAGDEGSDDELDEDGSWEDDEDEEFEEDEDEEDFDDEEGVDDGLDARVLSAFDADPLLATLPIEIDEPEPGTIALDGIVPNAKLIAHAVTIARGTPGVERVEHTLALRRPRRPSTGVASGR